jgi:glycosyltransferase involved in cell wall biosynthesis
MKVAHVVIDGAVAGGQLVALQLALAARSVGHRVSFVSPSEGPFLELVRAEGIRAAVVPIRGAFDVRALTSLTRTFRRDDVEIVHTHGHLAVNVVARAAGRLAGARVLSHMHGENSFRAGRGRETQIALDNTTARLCFAIVAVSDATRESLVRQGYPRDRVVTVRNGIEPAEAAAPVRLVEGRSILEVARLDEMKGQRTLIEALAVLDANAVFVGVDPDREGAYRRELEALAYRLGVADRVVFAGHRDDVPQLLAGADVVCLPSSAEGLPIVLLEAMAQARPVVASAVGGTPEIVTDGETGLLVPPGDAGALARALARVLTENGLARRLGEAGRRRVRQEFSAAAAAERVLSLYEDAP